MKAALIDNQNKVVNVIVWDDTCIAPEGTTALVLEDNVMVSSGWTFDQSNDMFIPPQPYSSWTFNSESHSWESPVPKPDQNYPYVWNEDNLEWELI